MNWSCSWALMPRSARTTFTSTAWTTSVATPRAVQLGDVGERRNPAGSHSHLAVRARLPRDKLAIERVTRIDLQGVTVRGSDIAVDITVAEVGSLGASTVARLLHDRTLCLIKLEAAPRAVIDAPTTATARSTCSAGPARRAGWCTRSSSSSRRPRPGT